MFEVLVHAGALIMMLFSGYALKFAGIMRAQDFHTVSLIVMRVTLPCAIIANFSRITLDFSLMWLVGLGLACNIVTIAIGRFVALRKSRREAAFNVINYSGFNIGCFTLPFVQTFLPPSAVVSACLFDAGNSVMCTGATLSVAKNVAATEGRVSALLYVQRFFRQTLSSWPLDTYLIMILLAALGLQIPAVTMPFFETVGQCNTFLAMFMLGLGFELQLGGAGALRIVRILVHRYLIAAALALFFYYGLPFSQDVRELLVLVAFAPMSAICAVFTAQCLQDPKEVAVSCTLNSLSIVISMIFMTSLVVSFH